MPSFVGAREIGGLLGAGRNLLTGAGLFIGPELFQQGRSGSLLDRGVQNLPGIIPDPRTDAGRNLGRILSNELRYMGGQLNKGLIPYTQPSTPAQRPPMPGLPADYKQTELAAGAAAERFRPGAGFPGQQAAADRAYEQEKARVAQLTAQDPEIQRYEKARAAAKTQEEMDAARDIGMQMWAKANPQLAAKVLPGQSGYDAIQGSLAGQAAAQGYGYQMPQQIMMTPPPGVNVPQGLPAVQSFGGAETYGQQGLQIDPEMAKKFQALLNQSQK